MSGQTAGATGGGSATQTLTGVVLCGGQSTRMGSDKGLLKEGGFTWMELAASKLKALGLRVVVSLNQRQQPIYQTLFPEESFVVDRDDLALNGPMLALLSVHLQFPENDLFLLACDMKNMTTTVLEDLRNQYRKETNEAAVYSMPEKRQPLCGIYTAAGLKKIHGLFQAKRLKRHSMMAVLETLDTTYVPVKTKDFSAFNNYNTPTEI